MKEKPGKLTKKGNQASTFATALNHEEVRSFVTIYRRFQLEREPANLNKTVALFRRYVRDHPFATLVENLATQYRNHLTSPCRGFPMFHPNPCTFTTELLIDAFIYTHYSHQPSKEREREFNECLAEVQGNIDHLTCLFMVELWTSSINILNVGRQIEGWFRHYCEFHGVTPVVLESLGRQNIGFGALEKVDQRDARILFENMEKLAFELWEAAGRPEGGPSHFQSMACEQLNKALCGGSPQ